jgi:hypothetical protein
MNMTEDLDHAESLNRITALIAEKRIARVQLTLGRIDADVAAERIRSADAELSRQWEAFRRSQIRTMSDQAPSV